MQTDPNPSVQHAIAQSQSQITQLLDALGLRLIDPTVEPEFRRYAIQRLEFLTKYVRQLQPQDFEA